MVKRTRDFDVMFVDPGLNGTGWALWFALNKEELAPPDHTGQITVPNKQTREDWAERSQWICYSLNSVLEIFPELKTVVIEMPEMFASSEKSFASTNSGSLFKLTYLVGSMGYLVKQKHLNLCLISPVEWKGQMSKQILKNRVAEVFDLKFPNHTLDAVGMGLAHIGAL